MTDTVSAIERLATMAEDERPRAAAITDALADLSDVREWAEALAALADALDHLDSSTDLWVDADREFKADAREEVVAALQAVVDAHYDVQALPPMGLGPEVTP